MQQYFWDKPMFKHCFTIGAPFVITVINEIIQPWIITGDKYTYFNFYKLIVIGLFIVYITIEIRYFKQAKIEKDNIDTQLSKEKVYLLNQEINDKTIMSLTTIFYDSSVSIDKITDELLKKGCINMSEWNYKRITTGICDKLYEIICLYTKQLDFSINIMLYDIYSKGKNKNITMIAERGRFPNKSSIFEEKVIMNKNKNFNAVKLFEKNKSDIQILINREEVNEKFLYQNDANHPDYCQYIGVPIRCNGNQMISLLQICALKDSKLGNTKQEIMDFVIKYVTPFTYFALFSHNIEKNMDTRVSSFNELEVNYNE